MNPAPALQECVAPPVGEVVSLARALRHLRLEAEGEADPGDLDDVAAAIAAAVGHLDGRAGILGRALLTQSWRLTAERPCPIVGGALGFALELGPVQAVTEVERLVDGAYLVVPPEGWRMLRRPGGEAVVIARGSWPAADIDPEAWRVTYCCGFGDDGAAVPAPIRQAILIMVGDLYANRESGGVGGGAYEVKMPTTVEALLAPYRRIAV